HKERAAEQSLPLRNAYAHRARGQTRVGSVRRPAMNAFPRREFLKGAGALIIGFTLAQKSGSAEAMEIGPYGPPENEVDSWIAIGEDGRVTLFTGCCELGTGSSTGLMQVMAEELGVPFEQVRLIGPDTNRSPDQFVSSGSRTISAHSRPIRIAAA